MIEMGVNLNGNNNEGKSVLDLALVLDKIVKLREPQKKVGMAKALLAFGVNTEYSHYEKEFKKELSEFQGEKLSESELKEEKKLSESELKKEKELLKKEFKEILFSVKITAAKDYYNELFDRFKRVNYKSMAKSIAKDCLKQVVGKDFEEGQELSQTQIYDFYVMANKSLGKAFNTLDRDKLLKNQLSISDEPKSKNSFEPNI